MNLKSQNGELRGRAKRKTGTQQDWQRQAHTAATLEMRELCHYPLRKPLLQRLLTAFD